MGIKNRIKVLVTAGPTREKIDAIRFIQNISTGRLGVEIAKEAHKRGYEVSLIYGPGTARVPKYINTVKISSTMDILNEVRNMIGDVDIFISAAAVADYSPKYRNEKIPSGNNKVIIELYPNPKVIEEARRIAREDTIFVTFKLEYDVDKSVLIEKAKATKGDIIVANDITKINAKKHPAFIIYGDKTIRAKDKKDIANKIFNIVDNITKSKSGSGEKR